LTRLGVMARISTEPDEINSATHVILPGVGSANKIMKRLDDLQLIDVLKKLNQPVLGICVGMQILFEFSEEGNTACLGIIAGQIQKLSKKSCLILPHMGWNTLQVLKPFGLMANITAEASVYFVHNFVAPITSHTCATAYYGMPFSAAVQFENFFGVQFHPERSGTAGHQILKNFLELER